LSGHEAPRWFQSAVARRPEHRDILVDVGAIHYRVWGPTRAAGIILVHGGAAHSGWWDHIAPLLATHKRVVALDLSGHGDSFWKAHYDGVGWADEVLAVSNAEGLTRPIIIGHSLGGWVGMLCCVRQPTLVGSIIVVDSPLLADQPKHEHAGGHKNRVYADISEATARYRTIPRQEVLLPFIVDHVIRQSLRQVAGGWTWKFDSGIFGDRSWHSDLLPRLQVPATLLRCEHGLISKEVASTMTALVPRPMPVIELPDAGHHPMFDRPLVLVGILRALLAAPASGRG
jgi:pimeloyl-ACP methyl ester carboxylesterase